MPPSPYQLRQPAPDLSPAALKRKVDADGQGNQPRPTPHASSHRKRQRKSHRRRRALRTEDDCELAADRNLALPNYSETNVPRLERQGAFRIPTTWRDPDAPPLDADDENRDLYRLGLLYDDEHLRGPGFSLDIIVHSEPVYSVRPARRMRKSPHPHPHPHPYRDTTEFDEFRDPSSSMLTTLGFQSGSLYDDMVRAQQLSSIASATADAELHAPGAEYNTPSSQPRDRRRGGGPSPTRGRNAPPLAVIYETQESSLPSPPATPIATSQSDLVLREVGEDFMLLEDAVSDISEEDAAEDVLSSATGDPWVLLGDNLQAATDPPDERP
ncbi:hypothetical protein SLS62_007417 [Diatrype stigma]|uniref:Uncharacterized protein n=1 Tax=Diatrype stigma TaxID=117547 RepID=A0AAN9UPW1_9PEZI